MESALPTVLASQVQQSGPGREPPALYTAAAPGGSVMDERERPPYLGELRQARRGNWAIHLLAGVLAGVLVIALVGGWRIHSDTVSAWQQRFQARPAPVAAATTLAEPPPAIDQATIDRHAQQIIKAARRESRAGWKCIDGIAFRPLPEGGWENVPGDKCQRPQAPP